jgi:hypothetical protein
MAAQMASALQALVWRSRCLSLAKTCSMSLDALCAFLPDPVPMHNA